MSSPFPQTRLVLECVETSTFTKLLARLPWILSALLLAGCRDRQSAAPPAVPQQQASHQSPPHDSIVRPPRPRSDYVGSQVCASCHEEIASAYASHPMGQSLGEVDAVSPVENFESTQFAPPGHRKYRVERTDKGVFHHESREDTDGSILYDQSVPIHFAVGSGVHGRSYLINRDGLLFMSSIGWYTEGKKWDLSPGYRPLSHQRFDRQVSDGCMACHAGRMNTVEGRVDAYEPRRPFLEESIGCERCHGPGGSHVERHRKDGDLGLTDFLVNPASLDHVQQDAVCNQCHLQGSRRITRYGRSEFDFRPNDRLTDIWMVNLGSEKTGIEDEFPAVTQAEQMHESACYQKSGQMVCTTCHDPHRSVAKPDRGAFYTERCNKCHGQSSAQCAAPLTDRATKSCIECHMPRLAATDVPHTSQTDHRIPRSPKARPKPAPRGNIEFYDEGSPLPDWEVNRAKGILIADLSKKRSDRRLADQALALLKPLENQLQDDVPFVQALGAAYLQANNPGAAIESWDKVLKLAPENPQALESLALYHHYKGNLPEARDYYERLIAANGWRAEFHGRFAHVLGQLGEEEKAIAEAKRCLELNPTMIQVHLWLAEVYERKGNQDLSRQRRDLYKRLEQ